MLACSPLRPSLTALHEPRPLRPPPFPIRADLNHRQSKARRGRLRVVLTGLLGVVLLAALLGLWFWRWALADLPGLPDKAGLWSLNREPSITFLDSTGQTVGVRGAGRNERLTLANLPPYVARAFVAAEDRRFYSHFGVDPQGLARAFYVNVKARRVVEGGSTITQQLARNLFLTQDQTLRRKVQEAALAIQIERRLTKDEILALYLDRIYFGAGAYGLPSAAKTYFAKAPPALTLSEAALLAALPKAPSRYARSNLTKAMDRSHEVLRDMQAAGWITSADQAKAVADPPKLAAPDATEDDFGYVLDLASARARELTRGGRPSDLVVRLTIDPRLQHEAAATVREGAARGAGQGATQGALVALGPNGVIRALVGGVDHRDSGYDRASQAMRQPGSAFKPFVYATALEAGLTPADVRVDAPVRYGDWAPKNAGGGYAGSVTLADAFARSINTIAVKLTAEVGPEKVRLLAARFGLNRIPAKPSLTMALGTYETTLLELVAAYQVLQQGGRKSDTHLIDLIATPEGTVLYRHTESQPRQVYDARLNGQMVRMMEGVVERGTGKRAALDRPVAGKTGTSQDDRDAWFVGFTPELVTGVWIGDDQSRPMKAMGGGDLPAELWKRFMVAALTDRPAQGFSLTSANRAEEARATFYAGLATELEQGARDASQPGPAVPATTAPAPANP